MKKNKNGKSDEGCWYVSAIFKGTAREGLIDKKKKKTWEKE